MRVETPHESRVAYLPSYIVTAVSTYFVVSFNEVLERKKKRVITT